MKLHTNKYAHKVLKAWEATAKYTVGSMVSHRASASWAAKRALAKGGIVIAINNQLDIPVKFVGLGEKVDDIERFDPDCFGDALFEA